MKKLSLKENINNEELKKMLFNHSYYESKARGFIASNDVSWGDINMMRMEVDNILRYVSDKSCVLDACCSNGFSTFEIAKSRDIKIKAFDYSAKAINIAKKEQLVKDPQKKIIFYNGNILNIDENNASFDIVYSIRVVINLPTWRLQKKAILQMHRVLKPKGLYLMSEAFSGSLKKLNILRAAANLKPLAAQKFNLYLEEKQLEDFVKKYFDIVSVRKFSSIYYAASRFLRYLTLAKSDKDTYINEINNLFSKYPETENSGDFGIQKLYVLKKK